MGACSSSPQPFHLELSDSELGALLKAVPLLAKFSAHDLGKLGSSVVEKSYSDEQTVFRQGSKGDGFYIIIDGEAKVTKAVPGQSEEPVIGNLHKGDYFGEAALINNELRGANVIASGELKCVYLSRKSFYSVFGHDKFDVQFAHRASVSAETHDMMKQVLTMPEEEKKKLQVKTDEEREFISSAVQDNMLFQGLSADNKSKIIESMWRCDVQNGDVVVSKGDLGDNFYVILEGQCAVYLISSNQIGVDTKPEITLGAGSCFGELALLYNAPRAATVVATSDSVLFAVDRYTFRKTIRSVSQSLIEDYRKDLKKVELLQPLSSRERNAIAEVLELHHYPKGYALARQGEVGDCMYILREGEISCDIDGTQVELYGPGSYFGERALHTAEKRAATLTCLTDVQVLRLDRHAFHSLLGPLKSILDRKLVDYQRKSTERISMKNLANSRRHSTSVTMPGTSTDREELLGSHIDEFKVLGTIGAGHFGYVQLADGPNNKLYAIKKVGKTKLREFGQQTHAVSERSVMARLDSPFISRLFATYRDSDYLYFVTEACLGGELFTHLRERATFDEHTARFYAACAVLSIEYMHAKGVVYRDLKPENIMLDTNGYPKLVDFGFSKDLPTGERTYTLCGTPDYLAPEIVSGQGHTNAVDWWTLGIFIFEMLAGFAPFFDESPMKIYENIMSGSITFPHHFSGEARNLIICLLKYKPHRRLGVAKGGASTVKRHPWFTGVDWDALYRRQLVAPIQVSVDKKDYLKNFKTKEKSSFDFAPYLDDGSDWDKCFEEQLPL